MAIDNEQIKKVANMARLRIDDSELEGFSTDFDAIINYIDQISSVDVGDISSFQSRVKNVMREDDNAYEVDQFTDGILANAPETKDGYIKVKKVL